MTQTFTTLSTRIRQHIAYRKTLAALRSLSLRSRIDLDIVGNEHLVARHAVYGL
ncbi:hypothetical protein P775_08970 [Puniceibacterium antarcticum]|uniref:Uncharacterized protein n=1 Tax=Puniceibacterium antarcticum TaxID=1206336 RepID=A0A2G8RHT2_9RHOB|nr:glyceraldehyde-3-phosphate dehydrogenase [Puniceibacterium antarcticum]PIL20648.1 hypothetical protein P775_08970 [Puniceibacterium antarcticum]